MSVKQAMGLDAFRQQHNNLDAMVTAVNHQVRYVEHIGNQQGIEIDLSETFLGAYLDDLKKAKYMLKQHIRRIESLNE